MTQEWSDDQKNNFAERLVENVKKPTELSRALKPLALPNKKTPPSNISLKKKMVYHLTHFD